MGVNLDKTSLWKDDVIKSVDFYNKWFMKFAPKAFRETRIKTAKDVEKALNLTDNLRNVAPTLLESQPGVLPMLRQTTCPPIARDRLIGLSGVPKNLVESMEKKQEIPKRIDPGVLRESLKKIGRTIRQMADPDLFVWLDRKKPATEKEIYRAATVVADRLCGAESNPIIRNAQERRQLASIEKWLKKRGYRQLRKGEAETFDKMPRGTFSFRFNVPVKLNKGKKVNIPIDAVVMRKTAKPSDYPLFFEAKSAGDFTNVNKRRKEESKKITQLLKTYGKKVSFNLFLCGYFDSGYLGYEASDGIDWVWEHRIDDLRKFGL